MGAGTRLIMWAVMALVMTYAIMETEKSDYIKAMHRIQGEPLGKIMLKKLSKLMIRGIVGIFSLGIIMNLINVFRIKWYDHVITLIGFYALWKAIELIKQEKSNMF